MVDGNGFTNKEILLELKKQVEEGFSKLEGKIDSTAAAYDKRISSLERWRSYSKGALAILAGVISFLTIPPLGG